MEIDLLKYYPKTKRNVEGRGNEKTEEDRKIARQFGKEFFDGDRKYGYGGYSYNEKYWTPVVPDFVDYYKLNMNSKILDIGCGKGFMLYDFMRLVPGLSVSGIDISEYAISNALADVKPFIEVANATHLPYEDNSFDLVISINTVHNLKREDCKKALQEIGRVSKENSYIIVDAFRTEEEQKRMAAWNLTAQTYMKVDDWLNFFEESGYSGDYYWFIP